MTPSADLAANFKHTLAQIYTEEHARVRKLVEPLSEERLWTKPLPFGNSAGHLLLHLTGNLNYYIGAQVAGTGYVRERDREFTDTARTPKADVLARFDAAVKMVVDALAAQSAEDLLAHYEGEREPDARTRLDIFIRCATHFTHHVGQFNFLAKAHGAPPE
jgi:uncharacterized damage-inducible protein DinB